MQQHIKDPQTGDFVLNPDWVEPTPEPEEAPLPPAPTKKAKAPVPEKVWTPDGVKTIMAPQEISFELDGEGPHGFVLLHGRKVWYREPSDGVVEGLADAENIAKDEIRRIGKEGNPGVGPDGKATKPILSALEAKKQSMAAVNARKRAYREALKQLVTAWELPRADKSIIPLSPAAIDNLPFNMVFELVGSIQQAATLGTAEANFLEAS